MNAVRGHFLFGGSFHFAGHFDFTHCSKGIFKINYNGKIDLTFFFVQTADSEQVHSLLRVCLFDYTFKCLEKST